MSVYENLELGAFLRKDKSAIKKDIENVFERFQILGQRKGQAAGTLSGGEQQMLAMGRGLMSKPKLLLLDEPSMGLAPLLVQKSSRLLKISIKRVQRYFWWNRMRRWRCRLPTEPM